MVDLVIAVVAVLIGGGVGGFLAFRASEPLPEHGRGQIARWAVTVLGAGAGAEIVAQLCILVHQLEVDSSFPKIGLESDEFLRTFDVIAVVDMFRGVLLYGGVLVGLAAIVGLIAARRLGEANGR